MTDSVLSHLLSGGNGQPEQKPVQQPVHRRPQSPEPRVSWDKVDEETRVKFIQGTMVEFGEVNTAMKSVLDMYTGPQYMDVREFTHFAPLFHTSVPDGYTVGDLAELSKQYGRRVDVARPLIVALMEKDKEPVPIVTFPRLRTDLALPTDDVAPLEHARSISFMQSRKDQIIQAEGRTLYIDQLERATLDEENIRRIALLRAENASINDFFKKFVESNGKPNDAPPTDAPKAVAVSDSGVDFDDDV